jgi:F-type H+-transporting ATPase subunit delta
MPNPRLAARYAKSLLGLAIETGQLEKVYTDIQWLQAVTKSSRDFVNLLRSPIVKGDKKLSILNAVTKGKISDLTAAFNRLLVTKGRESYLPEILGAFIRQYKEHMNIQTVKLTTAVPVSEEIRKAVIEQLKKNTDMKNIELETTVDEELIGGFVLQMGDRLVDASVAYDLKAVARQFENNDFIYKIR